MRRLPLNVVKEMFFTAAPVKAEDAAKWGILNHLVPTAELERFTYDLARLITTKAPLVVSSVKAQLRLLARQRRLRRTRSSGSSSCERRRSGAPIIWKACERSTSIASRSSWVSEQGAN
jgi:enoyl-CoA hydratase/carnithine racemase